jgi:hypothetical protein
MYYQSFPSIYRAEECALQIYQSAYWDAKKYTDRYSDGDDEDDDDDDFSCLLAAVLASLFL